MQPRGNRANPDPVLVRLRDRVGQPSRTVPQPSGMLPSLSCCARPTPEVGFIAELVPVIWFAVDQTASGRARVHSPSAVGGLRPGPQALT